jgi:glyoxylase-like metal-dependent hydrolase (beta-lactamase superfamily II)
MIVKSFHEPDSGTWTHLVADPVERAAAVIDPVWVYDPVSGKADDGFIETVLANARDNGFGIEWVLETHAHADHLTAAALVCERTGAKLACSKGIRAVQHNFSRVFNLTLPAQGREPFDRLLAEGDEVSLGRLRIHVMETPGHTSDGLTYRVGDAAFIGDTLFAPASGTGRCDFPGGDAGQLFDSIMKIYRLPKETRLFLCHDYPKNGEKPVRDFTVGESMRSNIHVREGTARADFIRMRTGRDRELGLPRLILPSLQVNVLGGFPPPAEENGVSYLKIPFNRTMEDLIKGETP